MSPGLYRFAKIYRTQLIESGKGSIVIDPVRVEVFAGTRVYEIMANEAPLVLVAGRQQTLSQITTMALRPDQTYIELIARVKDPSGAREYCENQIDRAVAVLSACVTPDLFSDEVWRGWIAPQRGVSSAGSGQKWDSRWHLILTRLDRQPELT
jgi:hypothetical protein